MASEKTLEIRSKNRPEFWHRTVNKSGEQLGFAANGKPDRKYVLGASGGLMRFPKKARMSKKERLAIRRSGK